jgi:N-succinyldiaminopimelate aminotransferase
LNVSEHGGGEAVTKRLWAEAALRVLPGAYLSRPGADGKSPGDDFIRVALVHPLEVTETALRRILKVLR